MQFLPAKQDSVQKRLSVQKPHPFTDQLAHTDVHPHRLPSRKRHSSPQLEGGYRLRSRLNCKRAHFLSRLSSGGIVYCSLRSPHVTSPQHATSQQHETVVHPHFLWHHRQLLDGKCKSWLHRGCHTNLNLEKGPGIHSFRTIQHGGCR